MRCCRCACVCTLGGRNCRWALYELNTYTYPHNTYRLLTTAYLTAPRLPSRALDLLSECLEDKTGARVMQGLMTLVELAVYRPMAQVSKSWSVVCITFMLCVSD